MSRGAVHSGESRRPRRETGLGVKRTGSLRCSFLLWEVVQDPRQGLGAVRERGEKWAYTLQTQEDEALPDTFAEEDLSDEPCGQSHVVRRDGFGEWQAVGKWGVPGHEGSERRRRRKRRVGHSDRSGCGVERAEINIGRKDAGNRTTDNVGQLIDIGWRKRPGGDGWMENSPFLTFCKAMQSVLSDQSDLHLNSDTITGNHGKACAFHSHPCAAIRSDLEALSLTPFLLSPFKNRHCLLLPIPKPSHPQ